MLKANKNMHKVQIPQCSSHQLIKDNKDNDNNKTPLNYKIKYKYLVSLKGKYLLLI